MARKILRAVGLRIPAIGRLYRERNHLRAEKAALEMALRAQTRGLKQPVGACRSRAMGGFPERKRAYAIVGSAGRTASHWLTAAFNLHDEVFFAHGPDLSPCKTRRDDQSDVFRRIAREMESFDFSDCDCYFDLLEARGDFTVYGNVHGLFPAPAEHLSTGYRRAYFGCGIIRHPVARVQSFVHRWRYEGQISALRRACYSLASYEASYGRELVDLVRRYGVNCLDEDAILFLRALDTVVQTDRYFIDSGLPLFQMERLVGDVDYFLNLFDQATGGLVEPDDRFVTALEKLPPIDRRQERGTARKSFGAWMPWQQRYFRDRITAAELTECYAWLGYNLTPIFARAA